MSWADGSADLRLQDRRPAWYELTPDAGPVEKLTDTDIVNIVAYLASLDQN
jgi:hypothetical protein